MITLIVIAIAVVAAEVLPDIIGNILGYVVECATALIHCIFSWGISLIPNTFLIGSSMYEDEFVKQILDVGKGLLDKLAIALLVIIAMWQVFKVFWQYAGLNGEIEEPWKIGIKLMIFATLVLSSYGVCEFIIKGPVDKAVNIMLSIDTQIDDRGRIRKSSASGVEPKSLYVADNISTILGDWHKSGLLFAIVKLIVVTTVDYKIFMFLWLFVQKYVNMIFYIIISPFAFACGVSRATSDVLKRWIMVFVGGIAMQLLQIVVLKMLNAYASVLGVGNRFNWSIIFIYFSVAVLTDKLEEILGELGLSGGVNFKFGISDCLQTLGKIKNKVLG